MLRTPFDWHLRTRTLALGRRTLIMGILNVTPDSFSDGGHFYSPDHTTTAPSATPCACSTTAPTSSTSAANPPAPTPRHSLRKKSRPASFLFSRAILDARPDAILSIDTFHASTARAAVLAGAEIVNDVSGHLWDLDMSAACADLRCGVVLMHTRGTPQDWSSLPPLAPLAIMPAILTGLRDSIYAARTAGTSSDHIVLDPGFGFGKLGDDNYVIHALLPQLHQFGLPILTGTSRKGFLGRTIARALPPQPPEAAIGCACEPLVHATLASNVAAILAGAHILRVHDVRPAAEAAAVADAILHAATLTASEARHEQP